MTKSDHVELCRFWELPYKSVQHLNSVHTKILNVIKEVKKVSHIRYRALVPSWSDPSVQAVSPLVTVSHPPGGGLLLLSERPAITFTAAEHHPLLAGTKLYCLVTQAHRCEQLAQGCYAAFAPIWIWTHDLLIASPTLYPLRHRATFDAARITKFDILWSRQNNRFSMCVSECLYMCPDDWS